MESNIGLGDLTKRTAISSSMVAGMGLQEI